MGRNLSPIIGRELVNLNKDADSRKSAMKALKSYVKDLDSKTIPLFLAQVSETKGLGLASGEYTISLYEVLARVHGRNIVPQIDNIMSTILKTLKSSAGSFPLHQACSKVVPAIARYGIDPLMSDGEKAKIIYSLCNPLCDVLMGPSENVASGAALCLKALVESDGWRFASDDVVNDICLRAVGALEEKHTQTNAHMGLAMALAKHNSHIVEAFVRSLVRSGLQILTTGNENSQKRLSAIQMINFLMKCVDSSSFFSELVTIIDVMEKCHTDQMPFVRGAAFEALQTARMVAAEKGSKFVKDSSPITGSNFSRRKGNGRIRNLSGIRVNRNGSGSISPRSLSPESRTINSFNGFDSFTESPLSIGQASCNFDYGRTANRRLWSNENGGVDVSLKDGLYSEVSSGCNYSKTYLDSFEDSELSDTERESLEIFTGFVPESPTYMKTQSTTSPQRLQSQLTIDDIRIFKTPRKLIRSLQDADDCDFSKKQKQKMRSPTSCQVGESPTRGMNGEKVSQNLSYEVEGKSSERASEASRKTNDSDTDLGPDGFELALSTGDAPVDGNCKVSMNAIENVSWKMRSFRKASLGLVCGLALTFPAVFLSTMWLGNEEECFNLVPT